MADFLVTSLRGGMNNSDPPLSLADDQCVNARNVEWVESMLGERRRGCAAIDLTGSDLVGADRITMLFRHLPTSDETEAELWALGVTGASSTLCRKTTTWSTVTPVVPLTLTDGWQYQVQAQTLHGKMFLVAKTGVNRLLTWDGTALRFAGMTEVSAAPTAVDGGGAGSFAGTRYYRVREVVLDGTTVLRRSEPSPVLAHAPGGSNASVTVTKPADMGENATHWELEASTDNATFYRIAQTVVGTATVTDSVAFTTGYAATGTLSEQSGDYTVLHAAEFLLADEDRLLLLGSLEDESLGSRMAWTPVYNDPGVGNDERIPLDPVSFRDLDTFEGGKITGAVGPVNGEIWIFKRSHIYKAVRTGVRSSAYDVICISKKRGAIKGSIIEGVDQQGSPCVYFLDPKVGPCRVGSDGLVRRCGRDIFNTWKTVNKNATVVSRVVFYEDVGQGQWHVATGESETPDAVLVLHVEATRDTADGVRRGWAIWDGPRAAVLAVCLFSTNIDENDERNLSLVPFVAGEGDVILRTDTGDDDNGTDFDAVLETKPYAPANILNQFTVLSGAVLGTAANDAEVDVTVTRDFGVETISVPGVNFTPQRDEVQVIVPLDNLSISELKTVAFQFADADATSRWELNQLALKESKGQTA